MLSFPQNLLLWRYKQQEWGGHAGVWGVGRQSLSPEHQDSFLSPVTQHEAKYLSPNHLTPVTLVTALPVLLRQGAVTLKTTDLPHLQHGSMLAQLLGCRNRSSANLSGTSRKAKLSSWLMNLCLEGFLLQGSHECMTQPLRRVLIKCSGVYPLRLLWGGILSVSWVLDSHLRHVLNRKLKVLSHSWVSNEVQTRCNLQF